MASAEAARTAARYNAIKAMGVLIQLNEANFRELVRKRSNPVIVLGEVGVFSKKLIYFFALDGFVFYCKSPMLPDLPSCELIRAEKVRLPEI